MIVGEYVRVWINDTQSRRGVIAVDHSNGLQDLILVSGYDDFEILEKEELNYVDISRIFPVFEWEKNVSKNPDSLRELGKNLFLIKDWIGAIHVYRLILDEIKLCTNKYMFREKNEIFMKLNNEILLLNPSDLNNPFSKLTSHPSSSSSRYPVHDSIEFQISVLLNLGRCLLEFDEFEKVSEAIDFFSYAIYLSCCSTVVLRGKSFYWRAQARMKLDRGDAALRDAIIASQLSPSFETGSLIKRAESLIKTNKNKLRELTRGIMTICESHISNGLLDINI